jgi:hypothetical protein
MNITQNEAAEMIRTSGGKLFSVTFTKRSDRRKMGDSPNLPRRRMVARTGVRKDVTGEGQKFDPKAHGLIVVHEFVTQPDTTRGEKGHFAGGGNLATQFRNVPIEGIEELRIQGKVFQVN